MFRRVLNKLKVFFMLTMLYLPYSGRFYGDHWPVCRTVIRINKGVNTTKGDGLYATKIIDNFEFEIVTICRFLGSYDSTDRKKYCT